MDGPYRFGACRPAVEVPSRPAGQFRIITVSTPAAENVQRCGRAVAANQTAAEGVSAIRTVHSYGLEGTLTALHGPSLRRPLIQPSARLMSGAPAWLFTRIQMAVCPCLWCAQLPC
jgi:hypothetical protein